MTGEYPEHEKVKEIQAKSQAIGEFLDFGGYVLCEWHDEPDVPQFIDADTGAPSRLFHSNSVANPEWAPAGYYPVPRSIQDILARHFGIDLDKLEEEKREMIERLRAAR